jgi:hypothetical protein
MGMSSIRYSPDPHDIRLKDIHGPILYQLPATISVVLVFARRPSDSRHTLLQEFVSGYIVWVENLLPPFDVKSLIDTFLSQLNGIVNVERHVAVYHDWEIGADVVSTFAEELYVLLHTGIAFVRSMRKRYLWP